MALAPPIIIPPTVLCVSPCFICFILVARTKKTARKSTGENALKKCFHIAASTCNWCVRLLICRCCCCLPMVSRIAAFYVLMLLMLLLLPHSDAANATASY